MVFGFLTSIDQEDDCILINHIKTVRDHGLQIRDKSLHDKGGNEGCAVDEKGADDGKDPMQVWIQ